MQTKERKSRVTVEHAARTLLSALLSWPALNPPTEHSLSAQTSYSTAIQGLVESTDASFSSPASSSSMATRAFDFTAWPQSTLLLNESLAARGTELQGDDSRLSCVRASLAAGLRLTTAAIGGSITAGSSYGTGSAGASFLYHSKVSQAINAMYPVQGVHPHHNSGVPGTGPTYMEHCVHDHLPKAPGLILLEYAVNVDRRPASFERLLRRLLISQPQAALIVLNHHRWRVVRPHDGRTDKCWNPKWPVRAAAPRSPILALALGPTFTLAPGLSFALALARWT